ncbi:MAG: hypothetical protein E6R14_12660 [Thermomicrobiales bacterium]|nr:MAG: hypothetical protein E6R14_12660 [Thermomicrobiales bacterium]
MVQQRLPAHSRVTFGWPWATTSRPPRDEWERRLRMPTPEHTPTCLVPQFSPDASDRNPRTTSRHGPTVSVTISDVWKRPSLVALARCSKAREFRPTIIGLKMKLGFNLYLLFVVSWFLHLGARFPVLGAIRFDLLLVAVIGLILIFNRSGANPVKTGTEKYLKLLIVFCILTIPLVEWPGSVLSRGLEALAKASVFYFFTVAFVDSEQRIKKLVLTFVALQVFRVVEPLYLHVTEGYWGSVASMADWEYLERLSGAPHDVVNPNGLAFVICTALPFLYFLAPLSRAHRLAFVMFSPLCIYALVLTGSRTGMLGLAVIAVGFVAKARHKVLGAVGVVLAVLVGFSMLGSDLQDRYLSMFVKGTKNEATAEGRIEGVIGSFEVAMRRPLFGHGLGTSQEANWNFAGEDKPAHNLYAEAAQEIGFIGLAILLLLIKSIFVAFHDCRKAYSQGRGKASLKCMVDAMQIWLVLNVVFSFASYGLTSYEWYLLGGFSVALRRLAARISEAEVSPDGKLQFQAKA